MIDKLFIIAGSTKCATTSLDLSLRDTKEFRMIKNGKESNHFIQNKQVLGKNSLYGWDSIPQLSLQEYFYLFNDGSPKRPYFEVCTSYFHFYDEFIKSLSVNNLLDRTSVIVILRSPHSRAQAAYRHSIRDGLEKSSFHDALYEDYLGKRNDSWFMERYFSMSLYANNVCSLIKSFDNVLILNYDALNSSPKSFLSALSDFIEVDLDSIGHYNKSSDPNGRFDAYRVSFKQKIKGQIKRCLSYLNGYDTIMNQSDMQVSREFPSICVESWLEDLKHLNQIVCSSTVEDWIDELKGSAKCTNDSPEPVIFRKK